MSHLRKSYMRNKVISEKWIYLERHSPRCGSSQKARGLGKTHHTDRMWAVSEGKRGTGVGGCQCF